MRLGLFCLNLKDLCFYYKHLNDVTNRLTFVINYSILSCKIFNLRRGNKMGTTKRCAMCKQQKQLDDFHRSSKSPCGRQGYCKPCRSEYMRSVAVRKKQREYDKDRYLLHGEKVKSRAAVSLAVQRGDIPPVSMCQCVGCGEAANEYHHLSYNVPLDVEPLCRSCHGLEKLLKSEFLTPEERELRKVSRWFRRPIITTVPHWTQEARIILRLRVKGRSLRQIAKILTRIEGKSHNQETVNRRLAWAADVYRVNIQ